MSVASFAGGVSVSVALGGALGAAVGGISLAATGGDDGPRGLDEREIDESIGRGFYLVGGIGAGIGLLKGVALGKRVSPFAALAGGVIGALAGAVTWGAGGLAYQFAKNSID